MDRIVTLIENSEGVRRELAFEHGLSVWVEREGRAVLFDTGAGGAFLSNARKLGIDLSAAEALVVSHGHSDHAGGVRAFYETVGSKAPFVTGPGFFDPKYAAESGGHHYIGADFTAAWLAERGARHRVVGDGTPGVSVELVPGVHAVNGFRRTHPEETDSTRFVVDRGGSSGPEDFEVDDFRDEVCLAVETRRGLVVVLGCSHPGSMNMLDQVRARFGGKLHAVIGGTHLNAAGEGRVSASIAYLAALGCERIGIAHCSGAAAAERIAADPRTYYRMRTGSCLLL